MVEDGEELALRELLLDLERAVRLQTVIQLLLLLLIAAALGALLGIYLRLDSMEFATKVIAG